MSSSRSGSQRWSAIRESSFVSASRYARDAASGFRSVAGRRRAPRVDDELLDLRQREFAQCAQERRAQRLGGAAGLEGAQLLREGDGLRRQTLVGRRLARRGLRARRRRELHRRELRRRGWLDDGRAAQAPGHAAREPPPSHDTARTSR